MEMRAYLEGILRKIWLLAILVVISFFIGRNIGNNQPTQFTASTSISLSGQQLAVSAIPSSIVQIGVPQSIASQVATTTQLNIISKHYPRLSSRALQSDIVVSTDMANQILLISVTDIHPQSAADIANFLAQQLVTTQTASLMQQINYYQKWLQQAIPSLNNEINKLNQELQQLITLPVQPATQQTIQGDQNQLIFDERNLFSYQEALEAIQKTAPIFAKAYVILQPASVANETAVVPLSPSIYELIATGIGLLVAIILIVVMDYFTPLVRHKGELKRITGLSVLAELPKLDDFEHTHLLQLRQPSFSRRITALLTVCAWISIPAMRNKGYTILLTSPQRKRRFAAILASLVAHNGLQTLLIDADSENSYLNAQLRQIGPCNIVTKRGLQLSFVNKTDHPHLFVLPATAMLTQNKRLTTNNLLELLPELQSTFSIIIIDAPPLLNRADTHLLATKASQTLLLVKKRRDSLNVLKMTYTLCQELKLKTESLLLS